MEVAAAAAVTNRLTGTNGIEALPEELLFEVLRRVGSVKHLFMLAVTCRRWLCRFADPDFLRGICLSLGKGHRARLLGFFFRPTRFVRCERLMKLRMTGHTSVSPPMFRPMPGSPLGTADSALTSFVPDDDDAFNYASPLGASRGFVLMRLLPRTFELDFQRQRVTSAEPLLLGLCNPITGERHVFPPTCVGYRKDPYVYGYAIVTAADGEQGPTPPSSGSFAFSRLLLITRADERDNRRLLLQSYTAAARSWSAPVVCLDGTHLERVGEASAAIHRGAAHWLWLDGLAKSLAPGDDYKLYKLSVDLGTARISLTKIRIRAGGNPILCVGGDDKLSVACVYIVHVVVWTQQDGGGDDGAPPAWLRTRVIKIPLAACDPYEGINMEVWRDFNRGSMLVMYRGGGVFILDLEKGVMEKIMDCFPSLYSNQRRLSYVPYEMDLVDFFLSCLSRWSNNAEV
ncbi:unnamed protein product [Urochloa humidicola]